MPAIYAHNRFGEAVTALLPEGLQQVIHSFPEALHLGFQGPDILFNYKPFTKNPIRQIGVDLHHLPAAEFFVQQAKTLLVQTENGETTYKKDAQTAYIVGFLCHFLLDATVHPDIYELEATGVSHGKIESELDKHLMRKDGKPTRGYNTADAFSAKNWAAEACAKTLGVSVKQARLAIKTMKTVNGFFSCKCEAFHTFAHALLKIAKMDRKFGDMFLHKQDDPACADCNQIVAEKLEAAVPFAAERIQDYFSRLAEIATTEKMDVFFDKLYTGGTL